PKLPGSGNFWGWLRQVGDTNTDNPARFTTLQNDVDKVMPSAAKTVSATYKYHYNGFMPIGPHAAVADVDTKAQRATIYVQAQALSGLPANLAGVINFVTGQTWATANNVRVVWYEGASSFGGGQTGEVKEQAAALSAKLGVPVRVQWMRWDQHGWDHWGMANLGDVTDGRRRRREDRRLGLTDLRPGPVEHRPDQAAVGHGHVAGDSGERRYRSAGFAVLVRDHRLGRQEGAREDAAAVRRFLQVQLPPCSECSAAVLRERADRRRARARDEHGPGGVPPSEHRRDDDGRGPLGGGARRRDHRRRLEAEGGEPRPPA